MITHIKVIPPVKDTRTAHNTSPPKFGVLYEDPSSQHPRAIRLITRVPPQYLRAFMRGE
ncbi:MAG: hypothetical protein V1929_06315 [bacterium]